MELDLDALAPLDENRKDVIGLDDLLSDHYKQQNELIEKEKKRAQAQKSYSSDEDEINEEILLSNLLKSCQTLLPKEPPRPNIPMLGLRRENVIGLDELLTDHYKQQNELIELEKKRAEARISYNSEEDDSEEETLLSNIAKSCQNMIKGRRIKEDISERGLQEEPLHPNFPMLELRREDAIGLDDLLTDHYKQEHELIEKEKMRAEAWKSYNSDDDGSDEEILMSNILNSLPKFD